MGLMSKLYTQKRDADEDEVVAFGRFERPQLPDGAADAFGDTTPGQQLFADETLDAFDAAVAIREAGFESAADAAMAALGDDAPQSRVRVKLAAAEKAARDAERAEKAERTRVRNRIAREAVEAVEAAAAEAQAEAEAEAEVVVEVDPQVEPTPEA